MLQLFLIENTKGSGRDQVIVKKVIPFPQGYSQYPEAGGFLDQDYLTMVFFSIFLEEERRAAFASMKK